MKYMGDSVEYVEMWNIDKCYLWKRFFPPFIVMVIHFLLNSHPAEDNKYKKCHVFLLLR